METTPNPPPPPFSLPLLSPPYLHPLSLKDIIPEKQPPSTPIPSPLPPHLPFLPSIPLYPLAPHGYPLHRLCLIIRICDVFASCCDKYIVRTQGAASLHYSRACFFLSFQKSCSLVTNYCAHSPVSSGEVVIRMKTLKGRALYFLFQLSHRLLKGVWLKLHKMSLSKLSICVSLAFTDLSSTRYMEC